MFYDAFLVDVSRQKRMNHVSARGFGLGYIGSAIPFIISIAIILLAQIAKSFRFLRPLASKIAFVITAVWWVSFTIPMLKMFNSILSLNANQTIIAEALTGLAKRLKKYVKYRTCIFILTRLFLLY